MANHNMPHDMGDSGRICQAVVTGRQTGRHAVGERWHFSLINSLSFAMSKQRVRQSTTECKE
jgi:hypothetical protein